MNPRYTIIGYFRTYTCRVTVDDLEHAMSIVRELLRDKACKVEVT
jgi:hypothetical protein